MDRDYSANIVAITEATCSCALWQPCRENYHGGHTAESRSRHIPGQVLDDKGSDQAEVLP